MSALRVVRIFKGGLLIIRPVGTFANEVELPQYLLGCVQDSLKQAFPDAKEQVERAFQHSDEQVREER